MFQNFWYHIFTFGHFSICPFIQQMGNIISLRLMQFRQGEVPLLDVIWNDVDVCALGILQYRICWHYCNMCTSIIRLKSVRSHDLLRNRATVKMLKGNICSGNICAGGFSKPTAPLFCVDSCKHCRWLVVTLDPFWISCHFTLHFLSQTSFFQIQPPSLTQTDENHDKAITKGPWLLKEWEMFLLVSSAHSPNLQTPIEVLG